MCVNGTEVEKQSQVRKGMSAGKYGNLTGSDKHIQYDSLMMEWAGTGIGEIYCMGREGGMSGRKLCAKCD